MKASEVLRKYDLGERNFQGENLRGQSFKGKNLSGANFRGADIRGTSFENTNLQGVNFTKVQAGLTKRWLAFALLMSVLTSGFSGLFSLWIGFLLSLLLNRTDIGSFYIGLFSSSFLVIFWIITFDYGLIAGALVGAVAVTIIATGATLGVVHMAVAGAVTVAVAISVAIAITVAFAIAVEGARAGAIAVTTVIVIAGFRAFAESGAGDIAIAIIIVVFGTGAFAILGFQIAWRALQGDGRDDWVRSFAIRLASTGGTNFQGANLTSVNFTGAILKNANFSNAILTGTCFHKSTKLDLARPGETYLKILKIHPWLIGIGQDKNFDGLILRGINFQGKNLSDASFIGADLSEANVMDVNLSRAILVQTQLDNTDLTRATLTGAFIEDWGITADTKLEGVKCDYVFTRLPPDKRPDWLKLSEAESLNPNPQRKPDNWKRNFEEGEFADFITPLRKTLLDLYHNQPIDPRLAATSFQELQQAYPEAELELVSVAKTGKNRDKIHLKAATSPTADISSLHGKYFTNIEYLQSLPPKSLTALLIERGATLKRLLEGNGGININYSPQQNNNNNMSQTTQSHSGSWDNVAGNKNIANENSRNQNISGGTINASGAGAFSLGDISGTVANVINQLPNSSNSNEPAIKDLLTQLQEAVDDPKLSDDDKKQTLEQIETLATAGQNPQDETIQKKAKKAVGFLKVIAEGLEPATKLAQACAKVLPKILIFFGL